MTPSSPPADERKEAYAWANARVERRFETALDRGDQLVAVDGTGAHPERSLHRMKLARDQGYWVVLLHVVVSLDTAVARNQGRTRQVPRDTIERYIDLVEDGVAKSKRAADEYLRANNEETRDEIWNREERFYGVDPVSLDHDDHLAHLHHLAEYEASLLTERAAEALQQYRSESLLPGADF